MKSRRDAILSTKLAKLSLPQIKIDHRLTSDGDELALLPEELAAIANSAIKIRRQSGAARIVARKLLAPIGMPSASVPKSRDGAPIWPPSLVGSLTHDNTIAIAAIASQEDITSIGIDIEPAETLSPDLLELIATATELEAIECDRFRGLSLFVAKEAVYKAAFPLDRAFPDHKDVEVDLSKNRATVSDGRTVDLRFIISSHLVALATIPPRESQSSSGPRA